MAVELASAYVSLVPSFKGGTDKIRSELGGPLAAVGNEAGTRAATGFRSSFAAGAKKFAKIGLIAAAGIAVPVVAGLKTAFDEATEAAKIGKLTDAVIKSTGGVAKVSAAGVADLAEALSNKAGVDDEVIQEGENMLLTFTKIRNETGKGNDIFNQATDAALNMSVALGQDMKGASMQVGKALNDPIKGITALSRAGVSFTEQQKEQVKWLVASGDQLGAQKIILGEMTTQFGGAAEAAALPMDKLKVRFGNLAEEIGTNLMPVAEKAIAWVGNLMNAFDEGGLSGVLANVGNSLKAAWPGIRSGLASVGERLLAWVGDTAPKVAAQLLEWGRAFVDWIGPQIPPALSELGRLVGRVGSWMLDTGLPALVQKLREWGLAFVKWVGPQIPPLLAELGKLALKLGAWIITDALPKLYTSVGKWGLAFIKWVGPAALDMLVELGKLIGKAASWVITDGVPKLIDMGLKLGIGFLDGIENYWSGTAWPWLAGLPGRIVSAVGNLAATLWGKGQELIRGMQTGIGIAAFEVMGWFAELPGRILGWIGDLGSLLWQKGKDLVQGFINGITGAIGGIGNAVGGLADKVGLSFDDGHDSGRKMGEGVAAGVLATGSLLRAALRKLGDDAKQEVASMVSAVLADAQAKVDATWARITGRETRQDAQRSVHDAEVALRQAEKRQGVLDALKARDAINRDFNPQAWREANEAVKAARDEANKETTDAVHALQEANRRLLDQSSGLIGQGPKGRQRFRQIARQSGLMRGEIDRLVKSYVSLGKAQDWAKPINRLVVPGVPTMRGAGSRIFRKAVEQIVSEAGATVSGDKLTRIANRAEAGRMGFHDVEVWARKLAKAQAEAAAAVEERKADQLAKAIGRETAAALHRSPIELDGDRVDKHQRRRERSPR